jgi:hypothetical protein
MAPRVLRAAVVLVLLVVLVLGCAHGGGAGEQHRSGLATLGASRCDVTVPNNSTPPGERPGQGTDGNSALWTDLPLSGQVVGVRQELLSHPGRLPEGVFGIVRADGTIAVKFPWWGRRGATDALTITGHGLDQSASPLRVDAPPGHLSHRGLLERHRASASRRPDLHRVGDEGDRAGPVTVGC